MQLEILTQLITPTILGTILLLAVQYLRPIAQKYLSEKELAIIERIVRTAVKAAEQMKKMGGLEPEARHKYAVDLIMLELQDLGIPFNRNLVYAMIESVVNDLPKSKTSFNLKKTGDST